MLSGLRAKNTDCVYLHCMLHGTIKHTSRVLLLLPRSGFMHLKHTEETLCVVLCNPLIGQIPMIGYKHIEFYRSC